MDIKIQDKILLEELDLCKKIVIDGIITTNYDNLLEKIFSDFKTYIGQEELFFHLLKELEKYIKYMAVNPNLTP